MLAGAARGLQADGYAVSLLSRRGGDLGDHTLGFLCDWESAPSLAAAGRAAVNAFGYPKLVLAWSHEAAQVIALARSLARPGAHLPVFHVLGSAVSDPMRKNTMGRLRAAFDEMPGVRWHAIRLGFQLEAGGARWLTHEEICAGTLQAISNGPPIATIGRVAPWKLRPR